jgi:putative Mg2+ transporter-C (MgtC) family protein
MLVCVGAAMTMILGIYLSHMLTNVWVTQTPVRLQNTDVSRFGAQIINGIGFLGAGTVLVTGRQQVKGLTTAAGLWASACMGLCIGAGFIEGAVVACVLIIMTITVFNGVERFVMAHTRNINLYVEFAHVDDVGAVISAIKAQDIRIFDVEIHKQENPAVNQSAVFTVLLPKKMSHATALAVVAGVENVLAIEEL